MILTLLFLLVFFLIFSCFVAAILDFIRYRSSYYNLSSAVGEIIARTLPATSFGISARFRRSFVQQCTILPSGRKLACRVLELRLSSDTGTFLAHGEPIETLAEDAATFYLRACKSNSWEVLDTIYITIVIDDSLRFGRIPPARVLGILPHTFDAAAAIDREGISTVIHSSFNNMDDIPFPPLTRALCEPEPFASTTPYADADTKPDTTRLPHADRTMAVGTKPPPAGHAVALRLIRQDGAVLTFTRRTTIGRGPDAEFIVNERGVSRMHARVEPITADLWTLTDLGSTQGTSRNGQRIGAFTPTPIQSGDFLDIGPFRVRAQINHEEG